MPQVVCKFGGTSVSTRENWNNIVAISKAHLKEGVQPVLVCSALSQASNKLEKMIGAALLDEHHKLEQELKDSYIKLAQSLEVSAGLITAELDLLHKWLTGIALLKEAPAKTCAQILSLGELMITRLGHAFLQKQGLNCLWFDARDALKTTPISGGETLNYLAARCKSDPNPTLAKKLMENGVDVILTQGFIAANTQGETVLLGRGGSDTSAALFAATLQAQQCEIWTDVPGIYTANPHQLPNARLLKQLNYDEAQEIATMGGKVLDPNCIPPMKRAGIPMAVKFTRMPEHSGTHISKKSDENAPFIKSIQVKHNVTLIAITTSDMWQQVGFLADVFNTFKQHGFSVDLLSSSEFNVTLSLDVNAKLRDPSALDALVVDLNQLGRTKIIEPCSAVSLVGHHIRTVLPQLGPTLEVFDAQQVHLMSLASNDLNLTFVVDESQANKLCQKLHALLIESNPHNIYYSKSWQEEFGQAIPTVDHWWEKERAKLLNIAKTHSPCYVYDMKKIAQKADDLLNLKAVDQRFYAMKANPHPDVLRTIVDKGIGVECVSIEELQHVQNLFPDLAPHRILFTPNFCARSEYEYALSRGYYVTVDNLYPLKNWPEVFKNQSILLRIDPGSGAGHHKYVCTGGNESKFGIPKATLPELSEFVKQHQVNVIGLHAHSGSGILTPELWQETALFLADVGTLFPNVRILNLGGGLGIVEKPGQQPLDLNALDDFLCAVKSQHPEFEFWLEPGRYLVAESGVILAKVTQCKTKGKVRFVGIETGMNSLLRPALYGSYHEIVNLSRLDDEKTGFAHVVGPICESGDTLGYDRFLPSTEENDVLLIANAGAYGHCMSSTYNLRPPAKEVALD